MIQGPGIPPIRPSKKHKIDKPLGGISHKPLGGLDEVEDKEVHQGHILHTEFVDKGIEGFGREATSKVVIEQGWKEPNSRRNLEKRFISPAIGFGGWVLPGQGEPYGDCGTWFSLGCLHVEDHVQDGLLEEHVGKAFIQRKKHTCHRSECPVCYESWAGREAERIEWRLKEFKRVASKGRKVWKSLRNPIHLVVSPPQRLWFKSVGELRSEAYKWAKKAGFKGGSNIFHHAREACMICGSSIEFKGERCPNCGSSQFAWYFSPHFHMIGYGWIRNTDKIFEASGWIVHNEGVRKTVFGTALYQLSHAGIHKDHRTVTWFGALSYNTFRRATWIQDGCRPLPEREDMVCPMCGRKLVKVFWVGGGPCPLPDVEMGFYVDPGGWVKI